MSFTKDFDKYACHGDSITCSVEGFDVTARLEHDTDAHIDDDDCHPAEFDPEMFTDRAHFEKALDARNAWFCGEWFYCGVVLSVAKNGVTLLPHAASIWRVAVNHPESSNGNEYLRELANEMLPEALAEARAILAKLCTC